MSGVLAFAAILARVDHRLARIERALGIIEQEEEKLMTTVEQVAADFDQYKTDVTAAFARLQASIDAGSPDAQALADLDAAINGADAEANAEDPAPAAPPADGDTSGDQGAGDTPAA